MAPTKPINDHTANSTSSSKANKTSGDRVRRGDLPWKGLIRKDQLADLASEFGGDGDFIVCPGYTGTFGSATAVDKWGRLFIPGATTGYRITRSTLSTWRQKTAADERYAWWPAEMEKRGAEAVKASDVINGISLATWQRYASVYHKASKVRVTLNTRNRHKREAILQAEEDPADAAGALMSLVGARPSLSSSGQKARPNHSVLE